MEAEGSRIPMYGESYKPKERVDSESEESPQIKKKGGKGKEKEKKKEDSSESSVEVKRKKGKKGRKEDSSESSVEVKGNKGKKGKEIPKLKGKKKEEAKGKTKGKGGKKKTKESSRVSDQILEEDQDAAVLYKELEDVAVDEYQIGDLVDRILEESFGVINSCLHIINESNLQAKVRKLDAYRLEEGTHQAFGLRQNEVPDVPNKRNAANDVFNGLQQISDPFNANAVIGLQLRLRRNTKRVSNRAVTNQNRRFVCNVRMGRKS